eukprot:237501-Pleurochrysis_carterae.AAC.1
MATLGGITKVRVLELVAQSSQVGDVGRDFPNDLAQLLIEVSSRTFVALRSNSTQRTRRHAEAERKKERYEQAERPVLDG